jgi:hypothetical protein
MIRKLFIAAFFIACAAPFTFAQTTGSDRNKYDIYVGYSHNRVETGADIDDPDFEDIVDQREGFNGFEVAVTGNFSRYIGIKGDYAFQRKSFDVNFDSTRINADVNLHTLVGGLEFKDNAKDKERGHLRPFGHLLAGFANARFSTSTTGFSFNQSDTGFAAVLGGGLDVRVGSRFDIRIIQLDYNPIHLGGETQNNFRIGAGIVFR